MMYKRRSTLSSTSDSGIGADKATGGENGTGVEPSPARAASAGAPTAGGGDASKAPRFGYPAGEVSEGFGSSGRFVRRDANGESSASPSAVERKKRRGSATKGMSTIRSRWFRAICLSGGSFLMMMTIARRGGFSWPERVGVQGAVSIANAVSIADALSIGGTDEIDLDLQDRRLRTTVKYPAFQATPHTITGLLELNSDFLLEEGKGQLADVTAIVIASPSLEAQLEALLVSTVQPCQVWVAMPAMETAENLAVTSTYQKSNRFGKRLHLVKSDLFSDGAPGVVGGGGRGSGGDGRFFDVKTGMFQLSMQADTTFIWLMEPDVLPGSRFLYLLMHVSMVKDMAGVYGSEGGVMPAAQTRHRSDTSASFDRGATTPFALWDTPTSSARHQEQEHRHLSDAADAVPSGEEAAAGAPRIPVDGDEGGGVALGLGGAAVSGTAVSVLSPADVLFSQWFLHKDLIRLLFREKWAGVASGNGGKGGPAALALSYSLRRYAGVPSYVLPSDPALPEYSGNMSAGLPPGKLDIQGISKAAEAAAVAAGFARRKKTFRRRTRDAPDQSRRRLARDGAVAASAPDQSRRRLGSLASPSDRNSRALQAASGGRGDASARGDTDGSPSSLVRRLDEPQLRAQFRDLSARGGQFFRTADHSPEDLVLIVVDGRDQAELLGPLYRQIVEGGGAAASGGAEVFIVLITHGPDSVGDETSPQQQQQEALGAPPVRTTARRDCREVAEALGVSPSKTPADGGSSNNNAGRSKTGGGNGDMNHLIQRPRGLGEVFGEGKGGGETRWDQLTRWLGGKAQGSDEMRSHRFLTPEEFCLGHAFGVFHVRVGQDYRQAAGRPLDPFLEVYHGLSEVLQLTAPKIVAYIDAPHEHEVLPSGEAKKKKKGRPTALDAMLAAPSDYAPEETVVRAVEAAVRSAGGGGSTPRPIGMPLPGGAAAGAEAAKVLAYLPGGSLERWKKPAITLVLVHSTREPATMLSRSLWALSEAYYVGDSVELRLVLDPRAVGDPMIDKIVRDFEWKWGNLDVTYSSEPFGTINGGSGGGDSELPAGLAALEAFGGPGKHSHIIPMFSGARPDPNFYAWLKVAVMNEGYAPRPVPGLPLESWPLQRSLGLGDGSKNYENNPPPGKGDLMRRRTPADVMQMWGKFLALSVDVPQGPCPDDDPGGPAGCSRMWMYGSEAWGALRERCRAGLAVAGAGEAGGERGRPGELQPLEVACAVGDVANRGDDWGLEAVHVCGAGPRGDGEWQRARVWEVYPLQRGG